MLESACSFPTDPTSVVSPTCELKKFSAFGQCTVLCVSGLAKTILKGPLSRSV